MIKDSKPVQIMVETKEAVKPAINWLSDLAFPIIIGLAVTIGGYLIKRYIFKDKKIDS